MSDPNHAKPLPNDPSFQSQEDASYALNSDEVSALKTDDTSIRMQLLEQELDRTKDQMMRALADTENMRKRALREREDAQKYAISGFSRDLLTVADNLRRAISSISTETVELSPEVKKLLEGIEATERELLKCFERNGIQKIEPLDEHFDPNYHEVIFEAAIPNKTSGTIIQVIEAGYILNGRILRPARVGIAKNDEKNTPNHTVDTQA